MALDLQNTTFSISFRAGDGFDYNIYFYAGHHLNATAPVQVAFPLNVFKKSLKIKAGYEAKLPIGLPIARTCQLEINISNLEDGDWADIGKAILRGHSTSTRTVNGVAMYVPNRWVVQREAETPMEFVQQPSSQKIEFGSEGATFTIDLIGLEKYALETCTIEMLDLDSLTADYTVAYDTSPTVDKQVVLIGWDVGTADYKFAQDETVDGKRFYKNSTFWGRCSDKVEAILDAVIRDGAVHSCNFNIADFDNVWTFYEQDPSTNHDKGTALNFADLLIFGYRFNHTGTNEVGFFMSNECLPSFNNVWSFLRHLLDSMLMKGTTETPSGGLNFHYYKIFDIINSEIDLSDSRPSDFKIALSDKFLSEATSNNLGSGQYDVTTQKYISGLSSIDGDSNDSAIIFNTITQKLYEGVKDGFDNDPEFTVEQPHNFAKGNYPNIRSFFYKRATAFEGRLYFKVHDDCDLELGGSIPTIASNSGSLASLTYPDEPDLPFAAINNIAWCGQVQSIVNKRQSVAGVGWNRMKGCIEAFGNVNQATMEMKLNVNLNNAKAIKETSLGEQFTLDYATYTGITAFTSLKNTMYLTNIEYDSIEGVADCTFFVRGDTYAL